MTDPRIDELMLAATEKENEAWEALQPLGGTLMRLSMTLPATNTDEAAIKAAVLFVTGLIMKRTLKETLRSMEGGDA